MVRRQFSLRIGLQKSSKHVVHEVLDSLIWTPRRVDHTAEVVGAIPDAIALLVGSWRVLGKADYRAG